MNFLKMISFRWSKEEMQKWPSIRKTAYILLPFLFYLVVHDIAEILLWAGMELVVSNAGASVISFIENNAYTFQGIINALSIVLGIAAIWLTVVGEIKGEKQQSQSVYLKPKAMVSYVLLAVLAAGAAVGLNALFGLFGITAGSDTFSEVAVRQYGVNFLVGLVLYGIFSPFAEEAVFRGVIYSRMKRCFNYKAGLVFSSLLFGLYHGNLVQAVYGTILGLLIGYIYEKYESFAAPVVFHSVANLSIFALTYGNSFRTMEKSVTIVITIISLFIAILMLIVINKGLKSHTDTK